MIAGRVSKRRRQGERAEAVRRTRLEAEFDAMLDGPPTDGELIRHRARSTGLVRRVLRYLGLAS